MSTQEEVFEAITYERDYQDSAHGDLNSHHHSVCEWLVIMDKKLNDVKEGWYEFGDDRALLEMLKVISTGVACLEQHNIVCTR